MNRSRSAELFEQAGKLLVGGVNSPVRAFKSVGGEPIFFQAAKGAYLTDVDQNSYLDYIGSWGPMILGHAHPAVIEAVLEAVARGTSFGAPGELEVELARLVIERMPTVRMVRMVCSGTEATMSALRLARGYTGRDKVIKFEGCYHGHGDSFLIKAGSGAATFGVPDSAGVPAGVAADTLTAGFNNLDDVKRLFAANQDQIAAVICEPVGGNMGVVPPEPGFLEGLREITKNEKALLIFDEVMTGFRLSPGGAQELFGVAPDLTCMGKVIGGGLPVGAYGGPIEIMEKVSPVGPVYQAGTLSGNPVAMAAGLATLRNLSGESYELLEELSAQLADGLKAAAEKAGMQVCIQRVGSMLTVFFQQGPVRNFHEAKGSDTERFARFFRGMLKEGVNLPPSQFEAWFVSTAHTKEDIDRTCQSAGRVFASMNG